MLGKNRNDLQTGSKLICKKEQQDMLLDLLVLTVSPFIGKGDSSATSNTICKN